MNIVLWVLQVLLAVAFFAHGCLFLFPPAELLAQMSDLPTWFRLFLGAAEALAGIGLTLPGMTRVAPWLISWAAGGLMIVMASATVFHIWRGEVSSAITTVILFLLLAFVAYMRAKVLPIRPRGAAPQRAGAV
jgi:putative oxidoreductase